PQPVAQCLRSGPAPRPFRDRQHHPAYSESILPERLVGAPHRQRPPARPSMEAGRHRPVPPSTRRKEVRMKTLRLALSLLVAGFGLLQGSVPSHADSGPYRHLSEIRIGGEGGWDYLTVDAVARRLYVSHSSKTVVLDLDKNTIVGEIAPGRG